MEPFKASNPGKLGSPSSYTSCKIALCSHCNGSPTTAAIIRQLPSCWGCLSEVWEVPLQLRKALLNGILACHYHKKAFMVPWMCNSAVRHAYSGCNSVRGWSYGNVHTFKLIRPECSVHCKTLSPANKTNSAS